MKKKYRLEQILTFVFISGFSSLVFETTLNKFLAYTFGVSITATSVTLALFFVSLSLGSTVFGKFSGRIQSGLSAYGLIEIIVGFYLLIFPFLYRGLASFAESIVASGSLSSAQTMALNLGVASLLVILPAFLMGGTFPVLFQDLPKIADTLSGVSAIYAINTIGAATGVIVSSYLLFPWIGMQNTSFLAAALSFGIGAWALKTARDQGEQFALLTSTPKKYKSEKRSQYAFSFYFVAAITGFTTFGYEIIWFNVLSLILGNSVYAFAAMLFTVLLGIGLGAWFLPRIRVLNRDPLMSLIVCQMALAGFVYLELFIWDRVSDVFPMFAMFSDSFLMMEGFRLLIAVVLLIGPTFLIGVSFPLLLSVLLKNNQDQGGRVTGLIYAINTIGSVTGVLVANLLLINWLGNRVAFVIFGTFNLTAALAILSLKEFQFKYRMALAVGIAVFAVSRFLLIPEWNYLKMAGGQNVFFKHRAIKGEKLLYYKESTHSGAITVTELGGIRTLFTNGKFEGNDGFEIQDQFMFGVVPSIFVKEYGRACNVGLGVGGTLGAIARFPFQEIDVLELSPDIAEVADRFFSKVNLDALKDPRVKTRIGDGRNFLLAKRGYYDLISIQVSSIWFAGSGNLYNREFYEIANQGLRDGGIMAQWFQTHHISLQNIARIAKTMREVFPNTTLWIAGHQGILVAAKGSRELSVDYAQLVDLDKRTELAPVREHLVHKSFLSAFRHLYFDTQSLPAFISAVEKGEKQPIEISTDMNPILEYLTPRGNADEGAYSRNRDAFMAHKWMDLKSLVRKFDSEESYRKMLDLIFKDEAPTSQ